MKLAITMIPESGRVSPVFETAETLLVIRLCRSGEYSVIAEHSLPESESEKITFLRDSGVRLLICGAICNETREYLISTGMRIVPFVSGTWSSVVDAARTRSAGLPPEFIMPGCSGHHQRCCQKHDSGRKK